MTKVNVPFTNTADVQAAQKLTATEAKGKLGDVAGTKSTDSTTGEAKFENLAVGVYYVEETKVPDGYTPGAPFLVFVPMTNPNNTSEWNYNVHVYPKNSEVKADKKVTDADKNVGDKISYDITSDIPKPKEGGTVSKYVVTDTLDDRLTPPAGNEVTLKFGDGTAIASSNYGVAIEGQKITVTFNQTGLALLTANKDKKVVTTIPATVKEIGTSNGEITNQGTVIANNGSGGGDTTINTGKVKTKLGKLKVTKKGDGNAVLAGAEFQLYRCDAQANLDGAALTVNGADKWTTNDEGTFTVDGLHVTDKENNDKDIDKHYCLVETKAPTGYELLAKPVEFQMGSGTAEQAVEVEKEITNVKSTTPSLPLTGGKGIGLFVAIGALIIGVGVYAAKRKKA